MPQFLLVTFILLIIVNYFAAARINKLPILDSHKTLYKMALWIIPFMGAFGVYVNSRVQVYEHKTPAQNHEAPPSEIVLNSQIFDIESNLFLEGGVPILNWKEFNSWVTGFETEDKKKVLQLGRRAWLLHFREILGKSAYLFESDYSMILSTIEERTIRAAANYIDRCRKTILNNLRGIANFNEHEKSILIILNSGEDYYHYISLYYPDDGEYATSGGVFLDFGCPHFVVVGEQLSLIETVVAHELTHSALSHLKLPVWLDEGIAVNSEYSIAGNIDYQFTPNEFNKMHRQYWNEKTIQSLWSGKAFETVESQKLAYNLAQIMVSQMSKNWDMFVEFVCLASREDSAKKAFNEIFNFELGDFVKTILQIENNDSWNPVPISDSK